MGPRFLGLNRDPPFALPKTTDPLLYLKMYSRTYLIRSIERQASVRPISRVSSPSSYRVSSFHSSSSRRDDVPRSPYQIFVETLKEELKKNKELQDNVKTLQGDVDKFQDSESMKRAKEMYERARVS